VDAAVRGEGEAAGVEGDPGGPGSMRAGPKVTLPSDCSQVRCLDRSTHSAQIRQPSLKHRAAPNGYADGQARCMTTGPVLLKAPGQTQ
jgi:hypothetical protein